MALRPLLDADEIDRSQVLGEDTWELFETIEDSFDVELGDYRALCGLTITELAHEVSKKANYPDRDKCLSAVSFYRLRRAFGRLFDIPRTSIRPSTPISEFLPWKSRRAQWQILQEHLGLTLPQLMIPGWLGGLCLAAPAVILIWMRAFFGPRFSVPAILGVWFVLVVAALWASTPFAREFPADGQTFGGLAKLVLARNYAAFAKQHGSSTEGDVLPALQQLIALETAIALEEIPPYTLVPQGLNIY